MTSTTSETPYQTVVTKSLPLLVHVTAPATLPEGYTFEAEINGDPSKVFTCEVPLGGVKEGQVFTTELPKNYDGTMIDAPTGHWKDHFLYDLCSTTGYLHPSLWCSLCCSQLAMGQIMSRMQLTWLGQPGPITRTRQTFLVVFILFISYIIYCTALELAALPYEPQEEPMIFTYLRMGGNICFSLYCIYALYKTRESVRIRYQIPEQYCIGCEDLCCSIWCGCCTTAQMLRHTGEYETYPGIWCSTTGHPPGTPLVV